MPSVLGLAGKGVGAAASALGGSGKAGPTSTMNNVSTNTGSNTSFGTATPNLNPLMSGFQSSLVPALSSMYAEAQTPVYGATQVAQVANNGDAATAAASKALTQNLASRGDLNSGADAAGQTQLQAANTANTVGFENQLPLLNYQNEMQQTGNVLGLAEGLTGKALTTNTSSNTGNTFSSGSNTATGTGPAFASGMLSNLGGILGNSTGGGKGGGGGKSGGGGTDSAISGFTPSMYNYTGANSVTD